MTKKKITSLKIAGVYIGTVVGAGFASGQEILQFFCVFGQKGFLGLVLVTVLFILFGYIIMDMGYKLNSRSHYEIIRETGGKYLGHIMDYIITFFLFGALTAMIAGAGAMFEENFGIPEVWGNVIMAAATLITVMTGVSGVMNSISFIVPFLLIAVLGVSLFSMILNPSLNVKINEAVPTSELISNWFWAAKLYVSYNIVLSISVLAPLGANAVKRKSIRTGALLGGLGLGAGSTIIFIAILRNMPEALKFEIPMIFIAGKVSFIVQLIYALVLLLEVYTTAVGSLFGFVSRLVDIKSDKSAYVISFTVISSLVASRFGFSNLVKYLYPIIGYCGIILLILLINSKLKLIFVRKPRSRY